jgi:hypothetical protein
MAQYSLSYAGVTPDVVDATAQALPIKALVTGSTAAVAVQEIYIGGEAPSSTVNELVVNRPTTAGTYTNTQTPALLNPYSAAATGWTARGAISGTVTASTEPVHSTGDVLNLTFNAYGGVVRWVAPPGAEIVTIGNVSSAQGELCLLTSRNGTGVVSGHVIVEQL